MAKNRNLIAAQRAKKDEFYTQRTDIENELRHYWPHFRGKTIYCNCDDPRVSNFFHYFSYQFNHLGLKKLITTCYKNQQMDLFSQNKSEKAIYLEYNGTENETGVPSVEDIGIHHLEGNGDFRSPECIELLKQADIVVTNPPFSLFREYVAQLMEYDKKFLIIGNMNAVKYKEIFPLIKDNKLWIGHKPMGRDMLFDVPEEYAQYLIENKKEGSGYKIIDGVVKGRSSGIWFTNLDYKKRHEDLILYKRYFNKPKHTHTHTHTHTHSQRNIRSTTTTTPSMWTKCQKSRWTTLEKWACRLVSWTNLTPTNLKSLDWIDQSCTN